MAVPTGTSLWKVPVGFSVFLCSSYPTTLASLVFAGGSCFLELLMVSSSWFLFYTPVFRTGQLKPCNPRFFCVHVHIDKFLCDVSLFSNVKTEPGQKRIQDHLSRAFLACCCDQASSYYISSQSWLSFHQHGFRTSFLVLCLQLTALALRDRCSCNE